MEGSQGRVDTSERAGPVERLRKPSVGSQPAPRHPVHALQRSIGNRMTGQLVAGLSESSAGLGDSAASLPFLDRIQASFGRHDVSGVRSHTGGAASQAARQMETSAYTVGRHVVFDGAPDLHKTAHEAAHAIQQASGVGPRGGFGRAGDRHERHANAVADAVVAGRSAEGLLDGMTGGAHDAGAGSTAAVQCYEKPGAAAKRPHWVEFKPGGKSWDGSEILKNLDIQDPSIPRGLSIEWKSSVEEQMANAIIGGPMDVVKLAQGLKARIQAFQKEVTAMKWAPPPGIPDAAGCEEAWKVVHRIMIDTAFGGEHATLTYADLERLAGYLHLFGRSMAAETANPELLPGATWHQVPHGEVFVGEPTSADVRQGSGLGDCFFMSALAAVVDRDPELIKRHIKPAGVQDGKRFFWVLLYRPTGGSSGAQSFIEAPQLVDEQIAATALAGHDTGDPIYAHSNQMAHTKNIAAKTGLVTDPTADGYDPFLIDQKTGEQPDADTRELWPSLYEKAFAKLQGSYRKINGGIGDEALAALTGKPAEMTASIFSDDGLMAEAGPGTALWTKLWRLVEEEHRPVTAGTWQQQKQPELFDKGAPVDSGHAYTVQSLAGKRDDPGSWTVTLRDPRGDRCGKEHVTMSFADFRRYFSRFMWGGL